MNETTEDSLPGKIIDLMGAAFIIGSFAIIAYNYKNLPESIPVHFNYLGYPDRWSAKYAIFIFPIIGILVMGLLNLVNMVPESMRNFPVKLTDTNREIQNTLAFNLFRFMKVEIGFMMMVITFDIVNSSIDKENLSILTIIIPTIIIFGTIIWYLILSIKNK